ncbi:hypothetical protein [Propionibacterium freudenreichii]|uniref:hypothetical protein n=1 Tax=Propionibacterium freudenreichii TaxID=1744 RepID=UPI0039B6FCDB
MRNWLKKYRVRHAPESSQGALTLDERARMAELERENRELKAEAAFLEKPAAYFAREPR